MKNYKIHFAEEEREEVLNIISRSNDIVINQVEPVSAFVTIQLEDAEADLLQEELLAQIDREIRSPQPTTIVSETPIITPPPGDDQSNRSELR